MTRVLISLPQDFLTTVDYVADSEMRNRSELVREALRVYISQKTPEELQVLQPKKRKRKATESRQSIA